VTDDSIAFTTKERARGAAAGDARGWAVRAAAAAIAILAAAAILGGCGRGGGEIPVGCARGDAVPGPVREAVVRAAGTFYSRAEAGNWRGVYGDAASTLRAQQTEERFSAPMAQVFQQLGPIPRLEVEALTVIRFGDGFPHLPQVECPGSGDSPPVTFLLSDYPVQASLVERGTLHGDAFYFSTLWELEGSEWKLAAFFLKPAALFGKSSSAYAKQASAEREAGDVRNAALLYNVAIDLAVPNAWTRPGEVDDLRRKQSRLSVTQLPVGKVEPWPDTPDTFQVQQVGYTVLASGLGIMVRWVPGETLADTTALVPRADRLRDYVVSNFPEYGRVFSGLVLQAEDPSDPSRTWNRLYRLGKAP
jgi:hypothetical protein